MIRQHIPSWALILVASAFAAFTATDAHAGGVVTNCNNDTEFSNMLVGGGTVTFNCGTATIVLSSTKTIADFTTIDGGDTITLSGDNARRLFIVNPRARLELDNIVIEKGLSKGGDGGAIYNLDTVSISNSTFRNNATTSAWSGGAIFSSSHLAMNNTVFSNNEAGSGGAIYVQSVHQPDEYFHHDLRSQLRYQHGHDCWFWRRTAADRRRDGDGDLFHLLAKRSAYGWRGGCTLRLSSVHRRQQHQPATRQPATAVGLISM